MGVESKSRRRAGTSRSSGGQSVGGPIVSVPSMVSAGTHGTTTTSSGKGGRRSRGGSSSSSTEVRQNYRSKHERHPSGGVPGSNSSVGSHSNTMQSRQPQQYRSHGRHAFSSDNSTGGGSLTNTVGSGSRKGGTGGASVVSSSSKKPANTIAVPRPGAKRASPYSATRSRTLSPRRPVHGYGGGGPPPTHPNSTQHANHLSPQHMSERASVKKAIEDLNKAIGHERRIAAITNACEEFDHWDSQKHDLELSLGAANVLSLVLSMTDNDDEIRMICAALEMVYRGSHEYLSRSFAEVGAAVVPLLLRLLERCESGNMRNADVSIMNITKVLLYFSRVQNLRLPLVRHQGLLDALVRVATSILNADSRVARMRVLANLANSEVNRVTMFEHAGLVNSVVKVASLDLSDSAREYAAASLMDLAGSPLNQVPMARNDKLLSTLVRLSVTDNKPETREYAVTAIQNLAFAKENRTRLASFLNGVVLEAMKKIVISEEQNDKARRRAAGALTNLACDETAEMMGQHEGLFDVLADVSTSDRSDDVQKRASLALTKIANSITSQMPCHETLLTSLIKASSSVNGFNVAAVLRAKARIVENRFSMARHPQLLDTLARIASSDVASHKDKDDAMRAIMHLSNENANRTMMAKKNILDALVKAALSDGVFHADEVIRDSAITAIERLATEVSNRKAMARHDGLIVAIAKATEREAKAEKHSSDASRVRLAKPLLMSLLVAM